MRRVTGGTRNFLGSLDEEGGLVRGPELPPAESVELIDDPSSGGFLLLLWDKDAQFAGESWHQTVEEAMRQAECEFEIPKDGWQAVPDDQGGRTGTPRG